MITNLRLENFKSHRDTSIDLQRLQVLVGPNGAGKTSVLQAVDLLAKVANQPPSEVFRGEADPKFLGRVGAGAETRVSATLDRHTFGVGWGSARVPQARSGGRDLGDGSFVGLGLEAPARALGASVYLRLDAGRVSTASPTLDASGRIQADGFRTATVLARLKLFDDARFDDVVRRLKTLIPAVLRVAILPTSSTFHGATPESAYELVFDFTSAKGVAGHLVSEGTLATLALLTAMVQSREPRLVLIDDIGLALHPTAQTELMRQIRELLKNDPGLQIIATTHSPFIVDELELEEVSVCLPHADGSIVRPLSAHPQAQRAREAMTTGQLWNFEGEDWVEKPAAE